MGWHFVQDSGCKKGQDAATRRYVRSTVARNHYRKERQQLVQSQAIDDEQERNEADQAGPEAFLDLVDSKDARASIRVQARGQMSARRQKDLTHKDAKVAHGSAYSYHSDPWSLALANSTTNGGSDPFGIAAAGVAYQSGHDSLLHHCKYPSVFNLLDMRKYVQCDISTHALDAASARKYVPVGLECVNGDYPQTIFGCHTFRRPVGSTLS